jgi:hypothetical protein
VCFPSRGAVAERELGGGCLATPALDDVLDFLCLVALHHQRDERDEVEQLEAQATIDKVQDLLNRLVTEENGDGNHRQNDEKSQNDVEHSGNENRDDAAESDD